MSVLPVTDELSDLTEWLRPKTQPWRRMTIAIDGFDHSGKSTLARFLAWQLGMPVIELDFVLIQGSVPPTHDILLVKRLVKFRLSKNRPVIVEGVFVLDVLEKLGLDPEVAIRAENRRDPSTGSWPDAFAEYSARHARSVTPDYVFAWS